MMVALTWMVSSFELTSIAGLLNVEKRLLSSLPMLPLDLFRGGVLVLVSLLSKLRIDPLLIALPRNKCSSRSVECALLGGVVSLGGMGSWMELARTEIAEDFLLVGAELGDTALEAPEKLRCRSAIFEATPVPIFLLLWIDTLSSCLRGTALSKLPDGARDNAGFNGPEDDLSREPNALAAEDMRDILDADFSIGAGS
jgi:hypothetical protein